MPSLKTNVALNFLNTVTGIVFPVITFPYAARVLLPEGIGAVNFLQSIVAYIVLLTSLGIPMYAVREVAKYRDDGDIVVERHSLFVRVCGGRRVGYLCAANIRSVRRILCVKPDDLVHKLGCELVLSGGRGL